jgi:hypothetical protein
MGGKLLTYRPSSQRKPFEVHYARASKCSARSVDRCLQCPGTPQFVAALKQLNRDRKPVLGQAGAWRWVMPHRRTAPPLLRRTCSHAFNGLLRLCPPQLVQSGCQDMAEISRGKIAFILNRTPAGFTTSTLDGSGLRDSHARSSRPGGPHCTAVVHRAARFAPRLFQTPAHGDALALP